MFDDNSSIRYLMKEMDPSEEMLFEKKMMDDANLLIEVESLRKVNKRLSELPETEPPAHVTRKILREASDHYSDKKRTQIRTVYFSAAATVLVVFFTGAFLVYEQDNIMPAESTNSQSSAGSAVHTFDLDSESTSNGLSPWVDNNQEIHFNDRINAENAAVFDSMLNTSMERLRPLQRIDGRDRSVRGLHLTGGN